MHGCIVNVSRRIKALKTIATRTICVNFCRYEICNIRLCSDHKIDGKTVGNGWRNMNEDTQKKREEEIQDKTEWRKKKKKEMSRKHRKSEKVKLTRSITQSVLIYLEFLNRIFHLRTGSAIISFVNCEWMSVLFDVFVHFIMPVLREYYVDFIIIMV